MRVLLRHARVDAAVSVVLALTIFAFAAGSSSVARANDIARPGRWWLLGALLALAALCAAVRRPSPVLVAAPSVLAGSLVLLGLGSALWSVAPRVTVHRGVSLGILLLAAGLLAYATDADSARIERILLGVLGGAVAVGVAGLVVGAVDPGAAGSLGSRFKGFGEQATTDAMLYALALPVALLAILRRRALLWRAAGAAAFVLLDGLLIASGSRGPEVGAVLGLVVLGLSRSRQRQLAVGALAAATVVLALVVGFVQTREDTVAGQAPPAAHQVVSRHPNPGALSQELRERNASAIRSLWRSSGRVGAWRGAVKKANERPVLGWGFGTEDRVFENHYYGYQGDLVGSSWVGLYLQLGLVGVVLFVGIWGVLGAAVVQSLRRSSRNVVALACAATVAAALPLSFVESWVYSAGNVATLPFWLSALLLGTVVWGRVPAPAPETGPAPAEKEADSPVPA